MNTESTWNDPRITAYALGELSGEDLAEFEKLVEANPELAGAVEEARSLTGKLESLFASESTPALDQQRRDAILTAPVTTAPVTTAPVASPKQSWKLPMLLMATAATLLLLVGLVPWMKRDANHTMAQHGVAPSEPIVDAVADKSGESVLKEQSSSQMSEFAVAPSSVLDDSSSIEERQLAKQPRSSSASATLPMSVPASDKESLDVEKEQLGQSGGKNAIGNRAVKASEMHKRLGEVKAMIVPAESDQERAPQGSLRLEGSSVNRKPAKKVDSNRKMNESKKEMSARGVAPPPSSAPRPSAPGLESKKQERQELAQTPLSAADSSTPDSSGSARMGRKDVDSDALGINGSRQEAMMMGMGMSAPGQTTADPFGGGALGSGPADPMARIAGRSKAKMNIQLEGRVSGTVPAFGFEPNFGDTIDEGVGPGKAGDRFDPITDNPFKRVAEHPLSTFSVDVDTASYSKTRDYLMRANQLPRPDVVRAEEFLNYFDYDYAPPADDAKHPFATRVQMTSCPWNSQHRLARIALKGKTMQKNERPRCNLVFLIDTSGSMNAPNKLPLVVDGMQMLLQQLDKQDRVAITVYAGSAGLVLDSTKVKKGKKIRQALTQLSAGGSTNGGAGISLAYQTARDNFITDGVNRVILCTDGDFNVGTTGTDALVRMVEKEAKGGVFLSVLAFGMGNHNDSMLEQISGRGNGNYAFIDNKKEARKVLVDQTSGTLVTIAKDVKLQIEFNPAKVSSYRLIGYENRVLAKEDFNDDKKDAGEIGAGHAVTALYEIVPAGMEPDAIRPKVDDLKYQSKTTATDAALSDETMTLKLRYKQPDGDTSKLVEFPVSDEGTSFDQADVDTRFAVAVAGFAMQLRRSQYAGTWTLSEVLEVAKSSLGEDKHELRSEFVEMVQKASLLMGQQ